ncbi:MAG: ABC transporter ATP-binding protein [Bilifractor sp.]|jgi:oligopeptide transport system ATP-binding protein
MSRQRILSVRNLQVSFRTTAGTVHAVRGVSFDLYRGETVAIVGESGSGKSVTAKALMGLEAKNAHIDAGTADFTFTGDDGKETTRDILQMEKKDIRREINGRRVAMVFQDPMTSLNPLMPVGKQIMEGMIWHYHTPKEEAKARALELMNLVGITDAEKRFNNYPHQLSGGMRQRIVIAVALACSPDLLICDEPTTALDVTIQAKILELIRRIQKERNLSVIYITHDLGVVAKVADYVNVMYAGKIIESGTVNDIFYDAKHPYTWGLLSAMPDLETDDDRLYAIPGTPPNLLYPVKGDAFAPRNKYALNIDSRLEPPMFRVSDTHYAATWLLHPKAPKIGMPEELAKRVSRLLKDAKRMEEGQMSAEGIATGAMASEISRSEQLRKSKNHVQSAAADMTPEADHAAETETADALGDDAPGHPVKEVAV